MIYRYHTKEMRLTKFPLFTLCFAFTAILSVAVFFAYNVGISVGESHQVEQMPLEKQISLIQEQDVFTPEKLKSYIEELNIKFPDIVYAQAVHETGNFKSQIFRENNNLFGMKVAKLRPTTNQGEQYGHAFYSHWRSSVQDYAYWQSFMGKGLNKSEYLQLLNGYAEDGDYVKKISYKIR